MRLAWNKDESSCAFCRVKKCPIHKLALFLWERKKPPITKVPDSVRQRQWPFNNTSTDYLARQLVKEKKL